MTLENDRAHLLYYIKMCASFQKSISEVKLELQSGNAQFGSKLMIFLSRVTLKNDTWPWKITGLLSYAASSVVLHFIAIGVVTVRKRSIRVKIAIFLSRVTWKFDGWPWKTIGHLPYAASSFVYHFIATGEFKLKLQSGNAQFGLKSTVFFSCVTLKFDGWPSKTIGHLF